jgi:L-rhamnose mutarotase
MYKKDESDADFNKRVYTSIKRIVNNRLTKKQIGKRSIFISENKRAVFVCIPMRDTSSKSDHWLIFDKNRPIVWQEKGENVK